MTVRLSTLAACGLASTLVAAGPAVAHIGVTPGLLGAGDTQTLSLVVHNDVDRPMTGLAVSAPTGIGIVGAGGEWSAVVENQTATWTGGPLAPNTGGRFEVELAVDSATALGPVQLQAEQLYSNGGRIPWPVSVTVIPGEEESQRVTWMIGGAVILLATSGIALLALRRRNRTLQEE